MDDHRPRPASTRHAFALAFDLAFVRDPVQSLLVPVLLMAPWLGALALLPVRDDLDRPGLVLLLQSVAMVGAFLTKQLVDAMLRFRARSVFNMPRDLAPAPALDCYTAGWRRLGWLSITEIARSIALAAAFSAFFIPGVWLGYRLAFATEAVVLGEPNLTAAFSHSFHLARRRFERWLEMIAVSAFIVLAVSFIVAALSLTMDPAYLDFFKMLGLAMLVIIWPTFQYAWTFFYLRLIEVEEPEMREVGPMYAAGPAAVPPPSAAAGVGASHTPTGSPAQLSLVDSTREPADHQAPGTTA